MFQPEKKNVESGNCCNINKLRMISRDTAEIIIRISSVKSDILNAVKAPGSPSCPRFHPRCWIAARVSEILPVVIEADAAAKRLCRSLPGEIHGEGENRD